MNKMWKHIAAPLMRRIGTALAGVLVGTGVGATEAEQIAVGVVAAGAVAIDLVTSYLERSR